MYVSDQGHGAGGLRLASFPTGQDAGADQVLSRKWTGLLRVRMRRRRAPYRVPDLASWSQLEPYQFPSAPTRYRAERGRVWERGAADVPDTYESVSAPSSCNFTPPRFLQNEYSGPGLTLWQLPWKVSRESVHLCSSARNPRFAYPPPPFPPSTPTNPTTIT